MKEDEIYIATKNWFKKKNFFSLAGQPPNGCDSIPSIEIKDFYNFDKGSKGSYKPDLVFANKNYLILVECKPLDNINDEIKLNEIDSSENRKKLLYKEILNRRLFERKNLEESFLDFDTIKKKLRYCLAHSGKPRRMEKVFSLVVSSLHGEGNIIQPTNLSYNVLF
jgi:hypothetical protein